MNIKAGEWPYNACALSNERFSIIRCICNTPGIWSEERGHKGHSKPSEYEMFLYF